MYRFARARRDAQAKDENVIVPQEEEQQLEIRRVGTTLLKMMEIATR
jgi:hypothetical protein